MGVSWTASRLNRDARREALPSRDRFFFRAMAASRFISESFAGRLAAFDIGADGSLSNRRV